MSISIQKYEQPAPLLSCFVAVLSLGSAGGWEGGSFCDLLSICWILTLKIIANWIC